MDIPYLNEILAGIASGGIIGISAFPSKKINGEQWDWIKIIKSLIIGGVVGGILKSQGVDITSENYVAYTAANGGITTIVDKITTAGLKWIIVKSDKFI